MRKKQIPQGKKSEQKAAFKRIWTIVAAYLPHNYAAFTSQYFKKQGVELDMIHIYSVKRHGYEDWDIMEFWVNEFVPSTIEIECFPFVEETAMAS
jgi:hypothetical protein